MNNDMRIYWKGQSRETGIHKKQTGPHITNITGNQAAIEMLKVKENSAGEVIQRIVHFQDGIVDEFSIARPQFHHLGSLSGNHTTAYVVIRESVYSLIVGYSYQDAINNLKYWVDNLPAMIGFNMLDGEQRMRYKKKEEEFQNLANISLGPGNVGNSSNWAYYLEQCATAALFVRNEMPLTYHEIGSGLPTGANEGVFNDIFSREMSKRYYNREALASAIVGLLDTRSYSISYNIPRWSGITEHDFMSHIQFIYKSSSLHKSQEFEERDNEYEQYCVDIRDQVVRFLSVWQQHLETLCDLYPGLDLPKYFSAINMAYEMVCINFCGCRDVKDLVRPDHASYVNQFGYPLEATYQ